MQPGITYTDQALFSLIAKEDENAFRVLFDRYRLELYATALKLTKSPLQAEEITQEVFINIWVSRARLTVVERPDSYIFRILFNKIHGYLRKESNWQRIIRDSLVTEGHGVNTTEEAVDMHESNKFIEQALQQLPNQQRTVYQLSRKQGLSIDEIAKEMDISPHTVKVHLSKALTFIRTYLKDVATVVALLTIFKESYPVQ